MDKEQIAALRKGMCIALYVVNLLKVYWEQSHYLRSTLSRSNFRHALIQMFNLVLGFPANATAHTRKVSLRGLRRHCGSLQNWRNACRFTVCITLY